MHSRSPWSGGVIVGGGYGGSATGEGQGRLALIGGPPPGVALALAGAVEVRVDTTCGVVVQVSGVPGPVPEAVVPA
jgi:hypothetical protein